MSLKTGFWEAEPRLRSIVAWSSERELVFER
jgi:hypothetical protein